MLPGVRVALAGAPHLCREQPAEAAEHVPGLSRAGAGGGPGGDCARAPDPRPRWDLQSQAAGRGWGRRRLLARAARFPAAAPEERLSAVRGGARFPAAALAGQPLAVHAGVRFPVVSLEERLSAARADARGRAAEPASVAPCGAPFWARAPVSGQARRWAAAAPEMAAVPREEPAWAAPAGASPPSAGGLSRLAVRAGCGAAVGRGCRSRRGAISRGAGPEAEGADAPATGLAETGCCAVAIGLPRKAVTGSGRFSPVVSRLASARGELDPSRFRRRTNRSDRLGPARDFRPRFSRRRPPRPARPGSR